MALFSHHRDWTFALGSRDHSISARIENRGLAISLTIQLDGEVRVQKKGSDLDELWGDYPLLVGRSSCITRAFRKGFLGLATDFELSVEGQLIVEGEHVSIAVRPPESQQLDGLALEAASEAAPVPAGTVPTIPILPAACTGCGASLAMDEVRWVGPLTAQCPYCGTNVPIEWRKIG